MTEQQQHLANLLNQRKQLIEEVEKLQTQSSIQRELLLKVQGAIEYLQQIGTTLPEETVESDTNEEESDS
jgi:prefoldin subunit 5